MKIAVIGTGYWGKNHVRALNDLLKEGKIEEMCVCDIDKEKVKSIASAYNISFYTSIKDLPELDGVIIATPSDTHYKIAKEFLKKGKDVLVEKPMTLNSKEANELIKIAEKNENILMVGHIFRYHPAVNEIRNRIKNFGRIFYIMSNRFSFRYPRHDMGVLFALGIHEVDIFCYLLSKEHPNAIFATIESYIGKGEETAHITTYFDGDIKGYAFESWLTPVYGKKRELIVMGSKLAAYVDYLKINEIKFFDVSIYDNKVEASENVVKIEKKEPLKEEICDFIKCMKERKKPIADMYSGKRAVEMIEKAIESAREGRKIKWSEF